MKYVKDEFIKFHVGPINKLYRSEFLKRINAQFGAYRAHEDHQFALTCMLNARKIAILKKDLYFYRRGVSDSLTSSDNSENLFFYFDVIKFYRDKFITDSKFKEAELQIISSIIYNCLTNLENIDFRFKEEYFKRIKNELKSLDFENNPYLDRTSIKNAQFIKSENYLNSKYYNLSNNTKLFSKQPIINYFMQYLYKKYEQVKAWLTH